MHVFMLATAFIGIFVKETTFSVKLGKSQVSIKLLTTTV